MGQRSVASYRRARNRYRNCKPPTVGDRSRAAQRTYDLRHAFSSTAGRRERRLRRLKTETGSPSSHESPRIAPEEPVTARACKDWAESCLADAALDGIQIISESARK